MRNTPELNPSFKESLENQQRRQNRRFLVVIIKVAAVLLLLLGIVVICFIRGMSEGGVDRPNPQNYKQDLQTPPISMEKIPDYTGGSYTEINENKPFFDFNRINTDEDFELYSNLDNLGRCGTAFANLSKKLMPTEERDEIGFVKPSGWHTVKYPNIIEDMYLYNRCHLIAYSLSGENANEKNLITGTRYFNTEGMLPFEKKVRFYILETGNHVLYRVTPVFSDRELVARGVLMEAYSVEDKGKGICFNAFIYNIQPGIIIDYSSGNSELEH